MYCATFFRELEPDVHAGQRDLFATILRLLELTGHAAVAARLRQGGERVDPLLHAVFATRRPDALPDVLETLARAPSTRHEPTRRRAPDVVDTAHPLIVAAVRTPGCAALDTTVAVDRARGERGVREAWALLARLQPDLHRLLEAVLSRVLLFDVPTQNGFASLSVHGLVGINTGSGDGHVFWLDELAHQGGHVVFNALTSDTRRFLAVEAATPLGRLIPQSRDRRGLYAALHGLFTYTCIIATLTALIEAGALDARDRALARGRIGFYLRKFIVDRRLLDRHRWFTHEGRQLFERLAGICDALASRHAPLLRELRVEGQPYRFDDARFLADNPWIVATDETTRLRRPAEALPRTPACPASRDVVR